MDQRCGIFGEDIFFDSLIVKFDEVMGEPDVFLFIYDPLRRCDGATYPARLVNFPWYVV